MLNIERYHCRQPTWMNIPTLLSLLHLLVKILYAVSADQVTFFIVTYFI
jgi:hypothetical protein